MLPLVATVALAAVALATVALATVGLGHRCLGHRCHRLPALALRLGSVSRSADSDRGSEWLSGSRSGYCRPVAAVVDTADRGSVSPLAWQSAAVAAAAVAAVVVVVDAWPSEYGSE